MENEEDIEAWYEEERQKALDELLTVFEKEKYSEKADAIYSKKLMKIYEKYKKKRLHVLDHVKPKVKKQSQTSMKEKILGIFSRR